MIPYTLNERSLTFFFEGRQRTFASEYMQFENIVSAVIAGDIEALRTLIAPKQYIERISFGDVIIDQDDIVRFRGNTVPEYLGTRIIKHHERNPELVKPLIKFAEKLMLNPNADVREDLFKWLEVGEMPIYPDGDFVAYKLVRDDYTPIFQGGTQNAPQKPGAIIEMSREKCNSNRDQTCSSGLHFCSYSYLPTFQSWNENQGRRVILLKINPVDVVAIPTDYNLSKGRTCRFEVIGDIALDKIQEDFGDLIVAAKEDVVKATTRHLTKEAVAETIQSNNGNKTAAAKQLGISRSQLYRIINA